MRRPVLSAFRHCLFAAVATLAPTAVRAQTIGVFPGSSDRVTVTPGTTLAVPIIVDLSAAGALNLAALQTALAWGTTRLAFDSLKANAALGWSVFSANTAGAAGGSLTLNMANGTALAASSTLATAYFTASAGQGGTRVTLAPTTAANELGGSVLGALLVRGLDVCVAPSGNWGEVNGDGIVNIIDAQQIARFSVGLSVLNSAVLTVRGDVNADGALNIIDAQQIARFSVDLGAAARINTPLAAPAAVASVATSPSGGQIVTVAGTQQLSATPRDGLNADVTGCASIAWASTNPAVATVSPTGLVTGKALGTATITATSGGQVAQTPITVSNTIVNAWANSSDGLWSNAANWTLGRVPATADSVVIAAPGTYTVTLDAAFTATNLTVGGAGGTQTLSLTSRVLTVNGQLEVKGGGALNLTNSAVAGAGAVLNQAAVSTYNSAIRTPLANRGLLVVTGSNVVEGALTTTPASLIRIQGDAACCNSGLTVSTGFTNSGAIELTSINGVATAGLGITTGTLVNAPGATITTLVATGGDRSLTAALDNQGTLTVNQPLSLGLYSAVHRNSGTITLNADMSISTLSGIARFTNTGTLTVGAGHLLTVYGSEFTQETGAILNGGGALSLQYVSTATFSTAFTLGTVYMNGVSASFATDQSTGTRAWTILNSTVNGSGAWTNAAGQTLSMQAVTWNAPFTNMGVLVLRGSSTLNGSFTTVAGSLLRVQGDAAYTEGRMTVANGFTNNGAIELTSINGASLSYLAVTTGSLINAAGGTIATQVGTGGARALGTALNNQGTITVNQPLSFGRTNAVHTNSGTMTLNADMSVGANGSGDSFTNTGTLTVGAGQLLTVSGSTFTHEAGATLNGSGALTLSYLTTANFNAAFGLSAITLNSTTANFATPQSNAARTWTITSSTLRGPGSFTNAAGQRLSSFYSTFDMPFVNQGLLVLNHTNGLNGALTTTAGSTLRVEGDASGYNAALNVATGFTNNGTIELTSINGVAGATLAVGEGTLINAAGATINSITGTGGSRTLTTALNNLGLVTVGQPLYLYRQDAAHGNSGTITLSGGDLVVASANANGSFANIGTMTVGAGQRFTVSGGSFAQQAGATLNGAGALSLISTTASFATAQTTTGLEWTITSATFTAPGLTNGAGQTLTIATSTINTPLTNQGTLVVGGTTALNGPLTTVVGSTIRVDGLANLVTVANGFTNNGTLELTSTVSAGQASSLTIAAGTLVNAVGGTISVLPGVGGIGGTRTLAGQVDNRGTLNLTAGGAGTLTLNGSLVTSGVINLQIGGTLPGLEYSKVAVSGAVTLGGTLNAALVNGFTPLAAQTFTILASGSPRTGTFNTATVPSGTSVQYNANSVVVQVP